MSTPKPKIKAALIQDPVLMNQVRDAACSFVAANAKRNSTDATTATTRVLVRYPVTAPVVMFGRDADDLVNQVSQVMYHEQADRGKW